MSRNLNGFDRPLIFRKRANLTRVLRLDTRTNYPTSHPWPVPEKLLLYATRISNPDQVQDTEDALPRISYLAFCYPTKRKSYFPVNPTLLFPGINVTLLLF